MGRTVLLATLTPGAFLELAEEGDGNGKTGEMQMLEISRQEIRKSVEEDARGLTRLRQCLSVWWFCYIYDPIATGFRFIHLVVIFMPVILTFPAVWLGKRLEDRSGERTGTLWWFRFLVRSMERAGPAFIKVGGLLDSYKNTSTYSLLSFPIAWTMGSISNRYLPSRIMQHYVLPPFQCACTSIT